MSRTSRGRAAQTIVVLCVAGVLTRCIDRTTEPRAARPSLDLSPSTTTDGSRIVFESNRDGNFEIYVMTADGSGQTRLTTSPGDDEIPRWSPDGTRIAFESNRDGNLEIYVMNADGSGQTRLTNNAAVDASPTWSPDGQRIAFHSTRDGNTEIYIMNADGTGQTRLTNSPVVDATPSWSPGTRIAFASRQRVGRAEVWVINPDGTGQSDVSSGVDLIGLEDAVSNPSWSPDGQQLAFTGVYDGRAPDVCVISLSHFGHTCLTGNIPVPEPSVAPRWSPDGNQIVFTGFRSGNYDIYVMNADGSGQTRLTTGPATDGDPDWWARLPLTVNATDDGDDGACDPAHCSLREAINAANELPGPDVIAFNLSGGAPRVIAPAEALPQITDPVTIDGTTQPDYAGTPVVAIDGLNAGADANGLFVTAGQSEVRGLVIERFALSGLRLENGGSNLIRGNYIGTDPSGSAAASNFNGIWIEQSANNTIGGTTPADGNVISGNRGNVSKWGIGIAVNGLSSTANTISGNFIGTDATGTALVPNDVGVDISTAPDNVIGGATAGAGNVISANVFKGVLVRAPRTHIAGNLIGTDVTGMRALGNGAGGVSIVVGEANVVGGTSPGARNVISGNANYEILIGGRGNAVQGNYIGTDVTGAARLTGSQQGGTYGDGVQLVGGYLNTVGGAVPGAGNVVSSNLCGIAFLSAGDAPPSLPSPNLVQGNLVGTDRTGTRALGNFWGLCIDGTASDNTIGGTTPQSRNIISGNFLDGVRIKTSASLPMTVAPRYIQGNYVGLDITGASPLGNGRHGIAINGWAGDWVIGGSAPGAANRIGANGADGVFLGGGYITSTGSTFGYPERIQLSGNEIFGNGGLGIELGRAVDPTGGETRDGVTANDAGDGDVGANGLQNYPALTSAINTATTTAITGMLESVASSSFRVEFFSNADCDPSGFGEGQAFIGALIVTSDADGHAEVSTTLDVAVSPGQFITATATHADGSTSELSRCVMAMARASNSSPSANAGGDQIVFRTKRLGASIALDGSGSSDPDGDALDYEWREGSTVVATGATPTVTLGLGIHTLTLEVSDGKGGSGTDDVIMTVLNSPPTAEVGGTYSAQEGVALPLALSGSDLDGTTLTLTWDLGDGTTGTGATPPSSHVYADGPASYTITLTALDADGGTDTKSTSVPVANRPPSAAFTFPAGVDEGSAFTLSLTNVHDVAADVAGLGYRFSCGIGFGAWGGAPSVTCPTSDNDTRGVEAEIRDKDGGVSTYAGTVVVSNVQPRLGPIAVPLDPIPLGGTVTASGTFTDPGGADTHTGYVQWDFDGSFNPASPGVDEVIKRLTASNRLGVGVYTISLRVRDDDGGEDTRAASSYVVVYDPSTGFVTGGGWITSPAGAYAPDPTLSDKASFGFVGKYLKGATAPSGNTEFQFQTARFAFQSTSYQWLVVAGARAQLKGEGTINGGATAYGFLLTAIDGQVSGGGGVDRFRIKIWDRSTGAVIYDNQRGAPEDGDAATALGGGSIVIHRQ